ncbi:hypothetical protein SAMD00019534_042060, partial [Acytostelium subglobosum LB1]|uniref:hypothetical protein n=1 Tax=Acytostelium subglobosum LB1 TaxID=1410327 RepID=UPI000644E895
MTTVLPLDHTYVLPTKVITNQNELNQFLATDTARSLLSFIQRMGDGVVGLANDAPCTVSQATESILNMLDIMSGWIDEIPPLAQPMRYGNKAYRTWHQRMVDNIATLHQQMLPQNLHHAIVELCPYIIDAMGNATRLDYGTGHELHFVVWMYCLRAIGFVNQDDEKALVLRVFPRYLSSLARKLQTVYGLEPAGTHGVWSLDDYQFIPFIWGAAQLTDNPSIKPVDILKAGVVDQNYNNYMYLACIKFINTVKKGPFHEHSPDLYNITGAASWAKIHQGMMKKFYAEVMTKVPIIQHFLFGSILPFSTGASNRS